MCVCVDWEQPCAAGDVTFEKSDGKYKVVGANDNELIALQEFCGDTTKRGLMDDRRACKRLGFNVNDPHSDDYMIGMAKPVPCTKACTHGCMNTHTIRQIDRQTDRQTGGHVQSPSLL